MAKKTGATPGDVIRYVPAPEPLVATVAIALLMVVELVFVGLFLGSLFGVGMVIALLVIAGILVPIAILMILGHGILTVSGAKVDLMGRAMGMLGAAAILGLTAAPALAGAACQGEHGEFIFGKPQCNHNSVMGQQAQAFWLGSALLALAAILSLYRKFFLPDVMIVKRRKLKYEDLM